MIINDHNLFSDVLYVIVFKSWLTVHYYFVLYNNVIVFRSWPTFTLLFCFIYCF